MKKLFFIPLLYFVIQSLSAQDHINSVFSSSPLILNPATTGTFGNSNLRVYTGYDWESNTGFFHEKTLNFSADKKLLKGKLGVGACLSYEFGDDIIKSKDAMLSAAYNTRFLKDNCKISVGIQGGLMEKSIDWDRILFNDPLSPGYGGNSSDSLGSPKDYVLYPDFNMGVLAFRNSGNSKIMPWIGFLVSHLFRPNVSFLSLSSPLPRKLTIHAGIDFPVNTHFVLTPLLFYTKQDEFKTLDIGGTAKYRIGSFSLSLGGINKTLQTDFSKFNQFSLLAEAGYAGFEIRMELFVLQDASYNRVGYKKGMIGLNWNLEGNNN